MKVISRRSLLRHAGAIVSSVCTKAPGRLTILSAAFRKTEIRVQDVTIAYEHYKYRTPIKFGGHVADRATVLNVNCVVRTGDGRAARGFGSMPLGNIWSFPSSTMSYETTLLANETATTE